MLPRLNISFALACQYSYLFGREYIAKSNEYLLNFARSGIVMALRAVLPQGGRVGVVAYNCYTVANAVVQAGCKPVFVDVTEDLHIDMTQLVELDIDALVLTNLFGIRNNVNTIRQVIGKVPIIADNAHGFGLPNEGDFTVYSINQGKFPALGEGGVLVVNNPQYIANINKQYAQLPTYSIVQEIKLFISMLTKAMLHIPIIYTYVTMPIKARRTSVDCRETTPLRKMANGVRRLYQYALPNIQSLIANQFRQADTIREWLKKQPIVEDVIVGDNAFMAVVKTNEPQLLQQLFAKQGIETATHFAKSIEWAKEFGYVEGSCPMAERLTKELIMIPTYKKIKL